MANSPTLNTLMTLGLALLPAIGGTESGSGEVYLNLVCTTAQQTQETGPAIPPSAVASEGQEPALLPATGG